jgi:hypothetical protein
MSRDAAPPDYSIAVVLRTLDLLEAIGKADAPVSLTDLARQVGATKSAAYRILANLETRGYVVKDAATARYQLGLRLRIWDSDRWACSTCGKPRGRRWNNSISSSMRRSTSGCWSKARSSTST